MATPTFSAILNFVKKYPIVLCGFSLLFTPSVHRLLLYFTPLLLSTAIFIVAMMSWGPSTFSEGGRRRSTRKVGHDWSFNGGLKMDDEEDAEDEEEEEEVDMQKEEISQKGNLSKDMQHEVIPQKGTRHAEPDPDLKREAEADPDDLNGAIILQQAEPNPDVQRDCVGTAPTQPEGQAAEPDPDLQRECVGTASNCGSPPQLGGQAEPDPDLQGEYVGTASNCGSPLQLGGQAEPDPDLQRDCVGAASNSASAMQYAEPDPDLQRGTASASASAMQLHAEPDPDLHAEQSADPDLQLQKCPAAQHDEAVPVDYHLHPSAAHDLHELHAQPAQMNHDQPAISELRRKLDMVREAPYISDDPHDMELAKAAVERLEASLGISGSSSASSQYQCSPDRRLQALHAAA